jgi:hypothetical protein
MRRLPSFNDFSPGIIGDVRRPLAILAEHAPDMAAVIQNWDQEFFAGKGGKRASTNIPATLTSLGLMTRSPLELTEAAKHILIASDRIDGAQRLV